MTSPLAVVSRVVVGVEAFFRPLSVTVLVVVRLALVRVAARSAEELLVVVVVAEVLLLKNGMSTAKKGGLSTIGESIEMGMSQCYMHRIRLRRESEAV